jgi:GxxExxY protein
MNTDRHGLKHEEVTGRILKVFYEVYNELGHGFLESVYESAMEIALKEAGLGVERQVPISVHFRRQVAGEFRADLLIEGVVIVELKATRALDQSHQAQVLNYLRATEIEVALLLNFGEKPDFKRLLFDNPRKQIRANPCSSVADSPPA